MTADLPKEALELRSLVTSDGTLELSLQEVPVPTPGANEVLVRVEAAPINPSDLGLLVASADMTTATVAGTPERPVVTAPITKAALGALSARLDQSLPVGNEGAGTVVAAGSSAAAQALIGKTVAIAGGAMYSQYRSIDAGACLVLPEGATARERKPKRRPFAMALATRSSKASTAVFGRRRPSSFPRTRRLSTGR